MNESYRMGEQSIIAHLQRLANGASTAELDVDALPTELRAVGEQLQKTLAVLQQERQLLERSAYIDSLTNLGNRGGLDRHVNQLWRKGAPFTCAYIDIDHLKHCNDKFGHAEGNRYILGICRALTEAMEHDEMLFRIGGDEFVLVSPTTGEAELEQRLERTRTDLVEATSDGKAPMIASFSFGCSHVDPLAGDTRRQMTMDADRKMYRYKLMHRVQQPKEDNAPMRPIADQLPCNDRVFQAISMSSETRYPFILNLDTGESQWSINAVRDFDLPSQHPYNSLDLWLARVHPEDRDNVRAELDMVINGTWHFHYMQYRVMDATEAYVLCDCTGYRLDGTDTEPNMYVGMIINRSLAEQRFVSYPQFGLNWGYKLANGDKCPLRRWCFARERISCFCHHRAMPQNPSPAWGGSRGSPERSGRPFVVACSPAHLSRRLRPRRADGATAPFRASMK